MPTAKAARIPLAKFVMEPVALPNLCRIATNTGEWRSRVNAGGGGLAIVALMKSGYRGRLGSCALAGGAGRRCYFRNWAKSVIAPARRKAITTRSIIVLASNG